MVEVVELKHFAALLKTINHHETRLVNRRKLYTVQEDGKQPSLQGSFCCKIPLFFFLFFLFFPFFKQLIQALCMRGSDSLTVKCWQMSMSSPSMLCLMLGEANSLSSCFSLFPARQRKDSTRGSAGASRVLGKLLGWSSPALLLGRLSCMCESSWHCQTLYCVLGRWGLVRSLSFWFYPLGWNCWQRWPLCQSHGWRGRLWCERFLCTPGDKSGVHPPSHLGPGQ